ncbi:phosphate ABC transporter substrate-binding protein [Paenibacillus sp. PsM32]|uniref:phosphate ABC transporter substrate-binding protein n=1 Tax=unclassified Paenibacillus TaxID=185978 RepID=UPI0023656186|nr:MULTISPECIES: phosphate ABC transporter substrate-binding protein [unclassified Paenibacillus]MDN4620235.1 phosphate ABC transporter substrate-binding protein [Paenibacillus sp. PsM32]WDF51344.1 phosphate ABC transporter substrate-binding protein [Paenibacillus sp. KACC 21273]
MSRKLPILLFTLTMILVLAACGSNTGTTGSGSTTGTTGEASTGTELSGSVLAVGSTALQPLVDQVAQKFMADSKYANISVQVQGGGSGTGLTQVSEGQANIGNSDVFAEEKLDADKAKELVDHQVAVVAIATVANEAAGVTNLTKQQLIDIFTGKVKNWKDVGGKDQAIVIVNRPSSSGTRATYEKFALGQKVEDLAGSIQEDSSGTVKKLVTETPGAIGYLALSYLDDSLKAIQYDGVDANVENVESGKYPVWAYEHMYTKGEPDAATKALLDYMLTDEVQNGDVKDLGYISISGMQVKRDVDGKITK